VVSLAATRSGHGYWIVATDGRGYWISTQRGEIFGFGDARRFANAAREQRAAGVVPTENGDGYWTAMQDGQVRASGAAGRITATHTGSPIISVATRWASSGTGGNVVTPTSGPSAALTFDDGPNPTYTPQILAALASAGVPATFFAVGYEGVVRPDLLAEEARRELRRLASFDRTGRRDHHARRRRGPIAGGCRVARHHLRFAQPWLSLQPPVRVGRSTTPSRAR
jgi:hypothetical protein